MSQLQGSQIDSGLRIESARFVIMERSGKKEIEIATVVANAVSHGETRICVDYEGLKFLSRYEMTEVVCSLFEVYGATQATQLMLAIFPFWMDLPYIKWLDIVTMLDRHDLALLWGVAPLMYKFLCVDVYECLVVEKMN